MKDIIEYLAYLWRFQKTKWGLIIACIPILAIWLHYILPLYKENSKLFLILTCVIILFVVAMFVIWFLNSGRFLIKPEFTVAFCMKAKDEKSNSYIENAMSILRRELDKLGLLGRFKLKEIGQDIINNRLDAYNYRENQNPDLIVWGEVFLGKRDDKEVCDFKGLSFTYRVPPQIVQANLIDPFRTDVNIGVVNRDWNIYEINSLPDIEKVSGHLSEIILFILGLIYHQHRKYAEDSAVLLERLFEILNTQTKGQSIDVDDKKKTIQMSPEMLRKSRLITILLNVYRNIGESFIDIGKYGKAVIYLKKYMTYEKENIPVLSLLALCCFHLNDLEEAKEYTNKINSVDKNNESYLINMAFFGIWERNYDSALFYYKEITRIRIPRTNLTKAIAFLDERKEENPQEIAYDFAIGLLYYYLLEKSQGIVELNKFLKQAKGNINYVQMVAYTRNFILRK